LAVAAAAATIPRDRQAEASESAEMSNRVMLVGLGYIAVVITAAVCVFLLAIQLHGIAIGVLLGILALIPCLGLFVLLALSVRATGILKRHGIHVGLFGANPNTI